MTVATCPKCNGTAKSCGYDWSQYVLAILFFPIGLLAFLERPKWRCPKCGFTAKEDKFDTWERKE